ncbi:hypothetical protein GJ496_009748 [Pomphorhynchus laevis]|nr:hypothetical protein GJ496_009748 [Pomphorhynchus laevis]
MNQPDIVKCQKLISSVSHVPNKLDVSPSSPQVQAIWDHWYSRFQPFLNATGEQPSEVKYALLMNHISTKIHEHSDIVSRYLLQSSQQTQNMTIDQFINQLKLMCSSTAFKDTSTLEQRNIFLRDAFKADLSAQISQGLLEAGYIEKEKAYDMARSIEPESANSVVNIIQDQSILDAKEDSLCSMSTRSINKNGCYFCGNNQHSHNILFDQRKGVNITNAQRRRISPKYADRTISCRVNCRAVIFEPLHAIRSLR